MRLREIASEFCSTYTEIHYFLGGFSLGFVVGWIAGSLFTRWGVL